MRIISQFEIQCISFERGKRRKACKNIGIGGNALDERFLRFVLKNSLRKKQRKRIIAKRERVKSKQCIPLVALLVSFSHDLSDLSACKISEESEKSKVKSETIKYHAKEYHNIKRGNLQWGGGFSAPTFCGFKFVSFFSFLYVLKERRQRKTFKFYFSSWFLSFPVLSMSENRIDLWFLFRKSYLSISRFTRGSVDSEAAKPKEELSGKNNVVSAR
jgi:hypothetical protein